MMIELFSFSSALIGGILIGLSALILLVSIGRIAGISGITANLLLVPKSNVNTWRIVFILGLILGAGLYQYGVGNELPFRQAPPSWLLVVGGLLVGFGTHLGSGCTSGHGVCGIGRFSKRSIVATVVFMFFAGATVFISRHVIG